MDLNQLTIRIDDSGNDWAEVEYRGTTVRRCHVDNELIDKLLEILEIKGATVEYATVTGKRV